MVREGGKSGSGERGREVREWGSQGVVREGGKSGSGERGRDVREW